VAPRSVSLGLVIALTLAWGSVALAEDYRPDDYLSLDLSKALLSPRRLGPATQFAPVPVEARSDAQARAEPTDVPKKVATERVRTSEPKVVHAKSAESRGAARTKLAHRRGNPLDAQAMDSRIQTWPCRSGGICDWRR
jgi:hypothetical protein